MRYSILIISFFWIIVFLWSGGIYAQKVKPDWLLLGKSLGCESNVRDMRLGDATRFLRDVGGIRFSKGGRLPGDSRHIFLMPARFFIGVNADEDGRLGSVLFLFRDREFQGVTSVLDERFDEINRVGDKFAVYVNEKGNPVAVTSYKDITYVECANREFIKKREKSSSPP